MNRYFSMTAMAGFLVSSLSQGVQVDTRSFVESVAGSFTIVEAGGERPKEINSVAEVEAEPDEAVFVMPFCLPDGLCDPGYLFFEYADATVEETQLSNGVSYELKVRDGLKTKRYTWEEIDGEVRFTNYQYALGNLGILTHVLEPNAEVEEAY